MREKENGKYLFFLYGIRNLFFFQELIYLFTYLLSFSRAAPTVYGGSQARGLIRAVDAGARATGDPNRVCELYHSSRQRRIPNPLCKARDQTCNLMVPSPIVNH